MTDNSKQPIVSAPMSEAAALENILSWSKNRPSWQRDALRRLIIYGTLNSEDLDALYAICVGDEKKFLPLSEEHISPELLPDEPISLLGVEDPVGVNALAPKQNLELKEQGLTIVYGDNGTGKSGYVRVLKHACRTRDSKVRILSEVGEKTPVEQTARIRFKKGAVEDAFDWSPTAETHKDLPAVSIFDSKSASTHVEATNNVAYTPFPMEVLENLSVACDALKSRTKEAIGILENQTPQAIKFPTLSKESPAGSYIFELSATSNKETPNLLTKLTEVNEARFKALESDLSQDSKQAIARLSSLRTRLTDCREMLANLSTASTETKAKHISILRTQRNETAMLAQSASETLFAASPLPEIGGSLWKSLWESARQYSDQIAYEDTAFPQTQSENDLCVLCQQPLDDEAVERRLTFEEFIKGTTKRDEADAKTSFDEAVTIANAALPPVKSLTTAIRLVRTELDNANLSRDIRKAAFESIRRIKAMVADHDLSFKCGPIPIDRIELEIEQISKRIDALRAGDASAERIQMLSEFQALKDRKALNNVKADVEAEIDRQIQIDRLISAAKTTAKVSVTNKNKELSDKLVTDVLRDRFAREVQKLEIGTMPIELRKEKDSNAQSFFRVAFVAQPLEPLGDILSEGEHRCVALAAFLAELVTSREYSGIVFDDPMSSLDHLYRKKVAVRLVEEAHHRQVVVFTHDLSFLFELKREADAQATPPQFQTFNRKKNKPGYIDADLPMKAKNAGAMASTLQSQLKKMKGQFDNWGDVERTIFCKGFIEQLRESWDQAIADFIFPVLGRFDTQIKTSSIFKLSILEEKDVISIMTARGRLSEDLHATSETLNPESTTPEQLSNEVKALIDWHADINKRQNSVEKPLFSYAASQSQTDQTVDH